MSLSKKIALITGASSGIGREFAEKLAEQGFNLILTARRKELLDKIATEISKKFQVQAIVIAADLSKQEDIDKIVEEIRSHDNLYFLVNNAGFTNVGIFEEIPWYKHNIMLSVHVTAPTQLAYAVIPIMKKNNKGVIINVSSVAAFIYGGNLYSPTKAYQVSLTKNLKTIFKGTNVIVQALCPGYTYTEFHQTEEFKGRDVYSEIPKFLWMSSEKVVGISLKAVKKKKTIVITSLKYKLIVKLINWGVLKRPQPKQLK